MPAPGFLTRAEEYELAIRWRDLNDHAAKDQLVTSHQPMVIGLAYKMAGYSVPVEDLIQVGNLGLMTAVARFDPDLGNRFSTFAQYWVLSAIQEYVLKQSTIVRPGTSSKLKSEFFRGVNRMRDYSIDAPLSRSHGDGEEGPTLADRMKDQSALPDEIAEQTIDGERLTARLARAVAKLKPRERTIIERRWLSEDGSTLETLGDQLRISKERVRQIEAKAIACLRKELAGVLA